MYITTKDNSSKRLWIEAKGNRKIYGRLLRERDKKAEKLQYDERVRNLKIMLSKGRITKEEFEEKTRTKGFFNKKSVDNF